MKRSLLALLAVLSVGLGVMALQLPAVASADAKTEICSGVNTAGGGTGCSDTSGKIDQLVTTAINLFSAVVGIVAVIMIVVGGFKYITSGGDQGNVTSAKNTIMYAVIGLVIVALAQVIVKFVLSRVP